MFKLPRKCARVTPENVAMAQKIVPHLQYSYSFCLNNSEWCYDSRMKMKRGKFLKVLKLHDLMGLGPN